MDEGIESAINKFTDACKVGRSGLQGTAAGHEPAMGPGGQKGRWHPGL